jgi:hypothetical protein
MDVAPPNFAFDRAAGSHALAAAGHRGRSAAEGGMHQPQTSTPAWRMNHV